MLIVHPLHIILYEANVTASYCIADWGHVRVWYW